MLLVLLMLVCCQNEGQGKGCPGATARDERRATALVALLDTVTEGRDVIRRIADKPTLCFGDVQTSSVTTEGVILLDRGLGDAEAAARLAHLLTHTSQGFPALDPKDCETSVERVLQQETASYALELRLRKALAVQAPRMRYEFEGAYWAAAPEGREAVILAYLKSHPNGGPFVDGLLEGYLRRCRGMAKRE